jgi:hypothetical protein
MEITTSDCAIFLFNLLPWFSTDASPLIGGPGGRTRLTRARLISTFGIEILNLNLIVAKHPIATKPYGFLDLVIDYLEFLQGNRRFIDCGKKLIMLIIGTKGNSVFVESYQHQGAGKGCETGEDERHIQHKADFGH